jgi:tetratricopeptide (TPR) repeat protein
VPFRSALNMGQDRLANVVGSPSYRAAITFVGFTAVLLLATAWNLTRSEALTQARAAYAQGDLPACLEYSLDHLRRRHWSREAALLAARCLSRLDYADLAEPYYQRAGDLSLGDQQMRAYGLVRGPHPERAIPAFNEILARSPENVTAMRRLAAVLLAQNRVDDLLKLADRLERTTNGAVIGATLRGVVHHNDKNPQKAVAAFERVLEFDPELGDAPLTPVLFSSHLADDLVASGRVDDARRHLTKALTKTQDPSLLNRLGMTYFLQGSLDDAERCFRRAVDQAPSDHAAHLNLAKVAIQRRNREEALDQLKQAQMLAPRHYSLLYSLVSVYRQLGRTAEADQIQQTLKQLRERPPSSAPGPGGAWPRYAL